jgi:hypothetical protein
MSRPKMLDAKESHVIQLTDFSTIGDIPSKGTEFGGFQKNSRGRVVTQMQREGCYDQ